MAKLKLDLHPIFNDSARIEAALASVLKEAEEKRIEEVEIIPGKGSGALKKTVLRFLSRPEVKCRYHRIVKDSDNWGRLFIYFRWTEQRAISKAMTPTMLFEYTCFFCGASNNLETEDVPILPATVECPACGLPNRLRQQGGSLQLMADSGY